MTPAQRLNELDRSSTWFLDQLNKLLHDKKWVEDLKLLPEDELIEVIGNLDNILDGLDRVGPPFRKCLHVLQKVCGLRMVLPAAYEVPGALSFNTMEAVAYGGFCDIYKQSLGGEELCIKQIRLPSLGERRTTKKALCKEAVVWKHLNHPNIVPFKGVTFGPLQLVSEWMPGGVLREYIEDNRHANLISLLLGVAKGLGYLHSCNVIHGDLKGTNILVDANGNARIVDFGLADVVRDSNSLVSTTEQLGVTARYTAPEILRGLEHHTMESDVFSFGMVIIEVFTGNVPFGNSVAAAAIASIITGERPKRPNHSNFTDRLWALVQRCWAENPRERPQMDQVITQFANQVPLTTLIQPSEPPTCENPEASPSTTASYTEMIPPPSPSPSPPLPQPPANFFGRDVIIEDLLGLVERSASIALLGAGGIGKTSIALTILHHTRITARFGRHRHFMRCDDLVSSLDGFLGRLSEAIGAPHLRDMGQLRSHFSPSPCILVLDGVESILDPLASGAAEAATAIEELGRYQNVCLFATSRMEIKLLDFRRIEVPTLSPDGALDTFHSWCSLERSIAIEKLLAELDFHPLSIVLLAGVVQENDWDEPTLLEAWDDGKTNILKVFGRQSLEDSIKLGLSTPSIQRLGKTALETLKALAASSNGVKESKLENMFTGIAGVGEAADELCKFSLIYRQDGFVKMLSPLRFYFLESMQTLVIHPGSNTARGSAADDIQCAQRVVDFGPSVGASTELLKCGRPESADWTAVDPAPASELPRDDHARIEQQPILPLGARLYEKIRSANRRILVMLRLFGEPDHPSRIPDGSADVPP